MPRRPRIKLADFPQHIVQRVINREPCFRKHIAMLTPLIAALIGEGAGQTVELNRWLRDPSGSGAYRRPDLRIANESFILDYTVSGNGKWLTTPQVADFYKYSGGNTITILRPNQVGGSYSILPPNYLGSVGR